MMGLAHSTSLGRALGADRQPGRAFAGRLRGLGACPESLDWARDYGDIRTAWSWCQRGDWMAWLAGRLGVPARLIIGAINRHFGLRSLMEQHLPDHGDLVGAIDPPRAGLFSGEAEDDANALGIYAGAVFDSLRALHDLAVGFDSPKGVGSLACEAVFDLCSVIDPATPGFAAALERSAADLRKDLYSPVLAAWAEEFE